MTSPLVTVIVPYYRHGRHLHQTVFSALRACSAPIEIIIVNDGSLEANAPVFLAQAKSLAPCIRVINQENRGLSAARNAGLANAQGEFIQLLDSDDLLAPCKIDVQLDQLKSQPKVDISISNYIICDETATLFQRDGDPISRFDFTLEDFLYKWERGFSIPIHSALFRREVFFDVTFETAVVGKEDWIFWCRQAHAKRRFSYIPVYGAVYRQHAQSMSKSYKAMGESWQAASQVINKFLNGSHPDFLMACKAWYDYFYRPRLRDAGPHQVTLKVPHRPQKIAAVHSSSDLSWIDDIATQRKRAVSSPRYSIVVPIFNHFEYLRQCLTSAALQRVDSGVQIVMVDDASTDKRVRPMLEAFAAKIADSILVTRDINKGISSAQNAGAEAATGEFICWLDCDDALEYGAVARVERTINADTDYAFTDRYDVDVNGVVLREARYGGYDNIYYNGDIQGDLLDGMVASHLKVTRREKVIALGGFNSDFAGVQDWELALRFSAAGAKFQYVPEPLYRHRIHTGSVTRQSMVRQFWLTNCLRRQYLDMIKFRPISSALASSNARKAVLELANGNLSEGGGAVVLRRLDGQGTAKTLKKIWRSGRACVYAPSVDSPIDELNLGREFNSYFDAVYAEDEWLACYFIGYMWNHNCLVHPGRLPEYFDPNDTDFRREPSV